MARDLTEVLTAMLAVIPESEAVLRGQLESVRGKALYTAPEEIGIRWRLTWAVLMNHVPQPTLPWQVQVSNIFRGPEVA